MYNEEIGLIQIVKLGQIRALKEFLSKSKNIDVNQKDEHGNFAAIEAARNNDLDILKILVDYGAKLNLKDGFGRTVDGWAKKHNNKEMIMYIESKLSETPKQAFSKTSGSNGATVDQHSSDNANNIIRCN